MRPEESINEICLLCVVLCCVILHIAGMLGTDIIDNNKVLHIRTCILIDCAYGSYLIYIVARFELAF